MEKQMIVFQNMAALENEMCESIVRIINDAIQQKGHATLLLSGGGTPKGLYNLLSFQDLKWDKINIGLVDERFVDGSSKYSNAKMIEEILIQNKAQRAHLTKMVFDSTHYEKNLKLVKEQYEDFKNADIVILGMGGDGHTASIFPKDVESEKCLSDPEPSLRNTNAPSHPEKRISLNKAFIEGAKNVILMFSGGLKKSVFEQSESEKLPIQYFKKNLTAIYFAEN
jgi:6-phosphogluconolactonase